MTENLSKLADEMIQDIKKGRNVIYRGQSEGNAEWLFHLFHESSLVRGEVKLDVEYGQSGVKVYVVRVNSK